MMQQVATSKSDIAALATNPVAEGSLDSGMSQEFERMLQDQQGKDLVVARPSEKDTSAFEKARKVADKSANVVDSQDKNKHREPVKGTENVSDIKSLKNAAELNPEPPIVNSSDEKTTKKMTAEELVLLEPKAVKKQLKTENNLQSDNLVKISGTLNSEVHSEKKPLQVLNEQPQVDIKQSKQKQDVPLAQKITADSDKVSEWVLLVENLQKLTEKVESDESTVLISPGKLLHQFVEDKNVSDELVVEKIAAITKDDLAEEKNLDNLTGGESAQVPEVIQKLVQTALEFQPSTKAEISLGSENQSELAVDELLKQPERLQQVFEEFSKVAVKESPIKDILAGGEPAPAPALVPEVIQKLVQKVLESQPSTKAEISLGSENQSELAVDELLKQPELLQQVFEEFSKVAVKESPIKDILAGGEPALAPEVIQKLVQKVLESQPSTKAEISLGSENQSELAVDELLKQPELLQQVFEEFSKVAVKESPKVDETVLFEIAAPEVSVVSDDNKALLNVLMTGTQAKNLDNEVITDISENVDKAKSAKQSQQTATDELLQEEQRLNDELLTSSGNAEKVDILETNLLKVEPPIAAQEVLAVKDSEEQSGSSMANILDTNSSSLKILVNLPEAKQDKVLTNIAQRLFVLEPKAQIDSIQSVEPSVNKEVADAMSIVTSPAKEFIGALKSGLSEFKDQLSKGHEPGIDLKSLVKESMNGVLESNPNVKVTQNSEQIMAGVSQLIDFATSINKGIEQQIASLSQNYSAALRDVSQIQGEQIKQTQLSQVESKLDKAVNTAKPEGLQQLAEKVRWMANTKNLVAEIRLDPAELGSVHVKVAMSGESATVSFVVQSQQTRDAMDNATPRLREMLAEKGIELGQSSVRQESDNQQQNENGQLADNNRSSQENIEDDEAMQNKGLEQKVVNGALGGIDYFV